MYYPFSFCLIGMVLGSSLTVILWLDSCEAYPFFEKGGTVLELSCCYGKLTTGYKIIVKYSLSGTVGYSRHRR